MGEPNEQPVPPQVTLGQALGDGAKMIFGVGNHSPAAEQAAAIPTQGPPAPASPPVAGVPPALAANQPPPAAPSPSPTPAQDTFTPPGPQTTSTSDTRTQIQGGQKVNPEIEAKRQEAEGKQLEAVGKATELEAKAQERIAAHEQARAAEAQAERAKQKAAEDQRRLDIQAQVQRVRDAQAALDTEKGPPEETTGQHVVRGIALALGTFGAALSGGENAAAKIIEADRAHKMQAWKAQYARTQGKVAGAQNLYAMMRQQGMDDTTAEAAVMQHLNEKYADLIRSEIASSKAPITIQQGQAALKKIEADNLAADHKIWQSAQSTWAQTRDEKNVTKEGGADLEGKTKLIKLANDDEHIQKARLAREALGRFESFTKAGADGAAVVDFMAGKGGMNQGSFGPSMIALLKRNSWFGQKTEEIRASLKGGVQPELVKEISDALAVDQARTAQRAKPSIEQFTREFRRAGIDPRIIMGGETSADAAAEAGATPTAYQGRQ